MKNALKALILMFSAFCGSVTLAAAVTTTTNITHNPGVPNVPVPSTTVTTSVTTTNGISESDGRIISSIYEKYGKDAALTGTQLTAASQNGIVTLSGSVTAQSQADEAVLVAKKVHGVKGVISNITVTSNPNGNIQVQPKNY